MSSREGLQRVSVQGGGLSKSKSVTGMEHCWCCHTRACLISTRSMHAVLLPSSYGIWKASMCGFGVVMSAALMCIIACCRLCNTYHACYRLLFEMQVLIAEKGAHPCAQTPHTLILSPAAKTPSHILLCRPASSSFFFLHV